MKFARWPAYTADPLLHHVVGLTRDRADLLGVRQDRDTAREDLAAARDELAAAPPAEPGLSWLELSAGVEWSGPDGNGGVCAGFLDGLMVCSDGTTSDWTAYGLHSGLRFAP